MRKIIQISSSQVHVGGIVLFALCDDGTAWMKQHDGVNNWIQVEEIPQPEVKQENLKDQVKGKK